MGFFDKVKNMFTEEVEEDVKVEQVKKEVTHVSIESPKTNKFDKDDFNAENIKKFEEQEFSKPVFFDDNDFEELNLNSKKETKNEPKYNIEKDVYGRKIEEKREEKKLFKPSPIISPVYGVLDKNYHKEDIVHKAEVKRVEESIDIEPSIDSIRDKAYGTLEDELNNTLFGNNSILFKQVIEESKEDIELEKLDDNALSNLTNDISKELDELLIGKEKYLEKNEKSEVTDDLLDFIDSTLYKGEDEE